jgi:hypothetical protein
MNCKINGELIDAYLSDNPWEAAQAMIEHAILGTVDPAVTTEETPVTATVTDDTPPVVA